jgi:hypothetical protein
MAVKPRRAKVVPRVPAARPSDPYLDWALATRFRYIGGARDQLPLLVELAQGVSHARFASLAWVRDARVKRLLRIAPLFATPPLGLAPTRFCTILVQSRRIEDVDRVIGDQGWAKVVARFGFGFPPQERPVTTPPISRPPQPKTPVVVGVIDDSIAFAHERFRSAGGGSRLLAVWNQEAKLRPRNGAPSTAVSYGGELQRAQVDAWLEACTHAGQVDEDELYRRSGHETYDNDVHKGIGRRLGHGTHVLDLATGAEPRRAPSDRPIVAVQLPGAVTGDTSGALLTTYVLDGVWYILKRADEYAASLGRRAVPVVINLSYGFTAGPHDGTHVLEEALDQVIELRRQQNAPVNIVLPAGNSRLSRLHARATLRGKARKALAWRQLPDDRTPSSMEIWLPQGASSGAGLEVVVHDPRGRATPAVRRGGLFPPASQQPAPCTIDYRAATPGQRERIVIVLLPSAPTPDGPPDDPVAPSGLWQVELRNLDAAARDVQAWIQRDDSPNGYPIVGRQSHFDDPAYRRFDDAGRRLTYDPPYPTVQPTPPPSYVRRSGTLNALATGRCTVVLAGVRRSDLKVAEYSSAGPPSAGPRPPREGPAPDAAWVSDDSVVQHGVLAAGTRSGCTMAMVGTSTAAPQAARFIADHMAGGSFDARTDVQDKAAAQEAHRPPAPATSPSFGDEFGDGRIVEPPLRPRAPIVR